MGFNLPRSIKGSVSTHFHIGVSVGRKYPGYVSWAPGCVPWVWWRGCDKAWVSCCPRPRRQGSANEAVRQPTLCGVFSFCREQFSLAVSTKGSWKYAAWRLWNNRLKGLNPVKMCYLKYDSLHCVEDLKYASLHSEEVFIFFHLFS